MKTINRTTLFLILTFVLSFSLAGIYKISGGDKPGSIGYTLLGAAYMFIPMISAIIVKRVIHHEKLGDLLVSFKINKWFFIAWGLMPIISICTLGISLLFPDVNYAPEMSGMFKRFENLMTPEQIEQMKNSIKMLPFDPIWITLLQGLIAGITINAVAGFGEEFGWRGFLLKEFKEMSFLKASIIIGFIWGIWHSPLVLMGHNYPEHPQIGVIMMIIWCILLTPIFIYITIKSKSIVATAILHGTLNATAGIAIMKIDNTNDLITGVTGLAGFLTILIFLIGIFIYDYFISKDKVLINKISNNVKHRV